MSDRESGAAVRETPAPYDGLNLMPIAGEWREGWSGKRRADVTPTRGKLHTQPL